MSKKKQGRSLSDLGGMVYSTNPDAQWTDGEDEAQALSPQEQDLGVHLEKKGRGGKVAVLIKGFQGSEEELKTLAKALKNHCAVGGSVKEGEIILQGAVREKAMDYLKEQGYRVKRIGG